MTFYSDAGNTMVTIDNDPVTTIRFPQSTHGNPHLTQILPTGIIH